MKRKVNVFKISSEDRPKNSLNYMFYFADPLKVIRNFLLIWVAKYIPSLQLKRILLRGTGMKIGKNVSIGLWATFDIFFPELIEIGDNTVIGYDAVVLAHEFLVGEIRVGKVVIGKDVVIGANSTILPGIEIGDRSIVSAMSLVNRDVPSDVMVGGIPARLIKILK